MVACSSDGRKRWYSPTSLAQHSRSHRPEYFKLEPRCSERPQRLPRRTVKLDCQVIGLQLFVSTECAG